MSKNAPPPPEPLPESIVLGLNAWNCASKISPANWETKLKEQVNINNGDSIFVKASYIDTRGTASQNIELAVDTEISLEYYFYWMHTFNACNGNELFTSPTTPDASGVLTQQVLVGGTFGYQTGLIDTNDIMGYYTSNGTVTNLNDADGLPYLVCQISNNVPVPPVVGTSKDASNIVVGNIYLVTEQGLTTNWAYAGSIANANYNKLPAGWDLQTSYFTATHNPQFDLPASEFIPANLAAPLPYITYQITVLGNTDWIGIDPGLASNPISALSMVNGGRYIIATVNPTWDFTYWGAGSNTVGDVFTATIPPALPVAFPFTISSATFLANVSTWFVANGGPIFGADPADTFNVVIDVNAENNMVLISVTGSGGWLIPNASGFASGVWEIPNSFFGFTAQGTPLANPVQQKAVITNITSEISGLSVNDLNVGTTYTVLTTGELDGSVPQFTWDMVGSFTDCDTVAMTVGLKYQIIAPQTNTLITDATNNGLVSEIFTASQTIILPAFPQVYNSSTTPPINDCTLQNEQGTEFITYLLQTPGYECFVTINANLVTGDFEYVPFNTSQFGAGSTTGAPFTELPLGNPQPSNLLTLTIPSGIQTGTQSDLVFVSNPTGNPTGFDQTNIYAMVCNTPIATPQDLIVFSGVGQIFTATAKYTGTGTTATVAQYTTTSAVMTGTGYTPPMVDTSVIEVGTIVHAINQDPAFPTDEGGRADVYAYQAGSTTPYEYDGYVADYTPATTRSYAQPVKKRWEMTLKAGSYDPNYLAELITRNMSRQKVKLVNNITGSNYPDQSSYTVPTDSVYNNVPSGDIWTNPISGGSNTFYDSKNPMVYDLPPSSFNYNLPPKNNDDMPFLFTPAMNSTSLHTDASGALGDFIWAQIPHPNANGLNKLPTGEQYYVGLVPLLNDVKSISPTVKDAMEGGDAAGKYSILPFYSQNSLVSGTPETGNSGLFPIVFGATQTSLIYNYENNGLFSFNYLHSPINAFLSTATNDLTECTAHMYVTQKVSTNMNGTNYFTTLIDKKSGVLLNKMEPASFWNQLGFDIPAITIDLQSKDDNVVGFLMSNDEFQARTTGGFCGSSNIFNQTFHTANSADQPNVPDTELIYLTATPAAASPADIIVAFTPNLTVGTSYKVYSPGYVKVGGSTNILDDWTSIGGPLVDTGVNMAGTIFTATSAGFDPDNPPDGYISWTSNPTVILADTPTTTITQLQNNYFQVTNTNTINAAKIPTQRDQTGHYLIEITGYNSIYIDDQNKKEIKSIVSSYYIGSAGSFVSQPFPDSYNYYHVGAPITLSNIKVRILDPYTNQEAQIGPNSSVYLQVNKLLTPQAIAQIEN